VQEFYDSPSMGKCSVQARYLFPAIWIHADDTGVARSEPEYWRKVAFGHEGDRDVSSEQVQGFLDELVAVGSIEFYTNANGRTLLRVPRFEFWQKVDHPGKFRTDECEHAPTVSRNAEKTPETVASVPEPSRDVASIPEHSRDVVPPRARATSTSTSTSTATKETDSPRKQRAAPKALGKKSAKKAQKEPDESKSGCPMCRVRMSQNPKHQVVQHFHDETLRILGVCPTWTIKQAVGIVERLNSESGKPLDDIRAKWTAYLRMDDDFLRKRGYTVLDFPTYYNGLSVSHDEPSRPSVRRVKFHRPGASPEQQAADEAEQARVDAILYGDRNAEEANPEAPQSAE
jgi:hypothetical protein